MPIYAPEDSLDFAAHGSTFAAYVNPTRGSAELCAWRLAVPPDVVGVAHRPSREEVLLVLEGRLRVSVDDETDELGPGSVIHAAAGSLLRIDTGPEGGTAWVTTSPGLTATTADGTVIDPPWAR